MKEGKMFKRVLALALVVLMTVTAVPFSVFAADEVHQHVVSAVPAKAATCTEEGNIAYYVCAECNAVFSDAKAEKEILADNVKIAKVKHNPVKTAEVKATCLAGGNNEYWTCLACNGVFKDEACTIATTVEAEKTTKQAHDTVKHDAKAATCLAEGNNAYYSCKVCKKNFKDADGTTIMLNSEIKIAKTAHATLTKVAAVVATCKAAGTIEHYKCPVCGDLFKDAEGKTAITAADIIDPKKSHKEVIIKGTPATCTTDGITDGRQCSECGEVFVKQETIKAPGHDLENYAYVAPTCYEEGKTAGYKCKREGCTYEKKQEPISKLEHTYGTKYTVITDSTCSKEGVQALVCTNTGCKEIKKGSEKPVAKKAHTWDTKTTVTKVANCTEKGEEYILCTICKEKKADSKKEIPALGHKWDEGKITKEATCTTTGSKLFTCSVCKATKTETVDALKHKYKDEVVKPTCEADGYTVKTCENCDEYYIADRVAKFGHKFTTYTPNNDASCTKDGTQTAKCDNGCGKTETIIDQGTKTDHKLTEWKVVTEATCTTDGAEEAGCFNCPYIEGHEIEALGHTIDETTEFTIDKAATCEAEGSKSKHCTRCDYIEQVTVIPATGHDMKETDGTTATCLEGGKIVTTCANGCGKTETIENGKALGHSFTNYVSNNDATCSKDGTETAKCDRCDVKDTRDVAGSALPHTYDEATTVIEKATTAADGSITKTCTVCGDVNVTVIAKVSDVKLSKTSYRYTGYQKTPALTVADANGTALTKDVDYKVTIPEERKEVGVYEYVVEFMGNYEGTKSLTFKVLPGTTSKLSASGFKQTSVKLTWKAVPGATAYRIYRYDAAKKKYVTVDSTKNTSYTVKKLKAGTDYKFAVKAYARDGKTYYWAAGYEEIAVTTKPLAPEKIKTAAASKSATIKWSKVAGADGYVLYMYKNGEWTKVKSTTKTGYTVTGLKSGTTYKFIAKAYVKNGSTYTYSPATPVGSVKAK